MTNRIYAGIGARAAPAAVLADIAKMAGWLARTGWHLSSGGAAGADSAFAGGRRPASRKSLPPCPSPPASPATPRPRRAAPSAPRTRSPPAPRHGRSLSPALESPVRECEGSALGHADRMVGTALDPDHSASVRTDSLDPVDTEHDALSLRVALRVPRGQQCDLSHLRMLHRNRFAVPIFGVICARSEPPMLDDLAFVAGIERPSSLKSSVAELAAQAGRIGAPAPRIRLNVTQDVPVGAGSPETHEAAVPAIVVGALESHVPIDIAHVIPSPGKDDDTADAVAHFTPAAVVPYDRGTNHRTPGPCGNRRSGRLPGWRSHPAREATPTRHSASGLRFAQCPEPRAPLQRSGPRVACRPPGTVMQREAAEAANLDAPSCGEQRLPVRNALNQLRFCRLRIVPSSRASVNSGRGAGTTDTMTPGQMAIADVVGEVKSAVCNARRERRPRSRCAFGVWFPHRSPNVGDRRHRRPTGNVPRQGMPRTRQNGASIPSSRHNHAVS